MAEATPELETLSGQFGGWSMSAHGAHQVKSVAPPERASVGIGVQHGRSGGDPRGSSADRRARQRRLTSEEAGFGGNGSSVPCIHCGRLLTTEAGPDKVEADKVNPDSRSYRRQNIQPSCRECNVKRSNNPSWQSPRSIPVDWSEHPSESTSHLVSTNIEG